MKSGAAEAMGTVPGGADPMSDGLFPGYAFTQQRALSRRWAPRAAWPPLHCS